MKVIYLDIDEEITAVIDKIKKTKGFDLALVIPKRSVLTQSIVNLKLLRKQIHAVGKNVVVVVSEKTAYNLAKRAGLDVRSDIPVGGSSDDSLENLQEEIAIDARSDIRPQKKSKVVTDLEEIEVHTYLEDEKEKGSPKKIVQSIETELEDDDQELKKSLSEKLDKPVFIPRLGLKLFFAFLGVSFLVAGLIFFVLLPKAEIVIQPEKEQYISNIDVVVESERDLFDQVNNALPGELIFFEDITETKTFETTTDKNVSTKARGQVTVFNSFSSDPQPLVANTRFQSADGRVYRLVQDASISGATIEGGQAVPGTTTVTVEADEPGPDFNIEAGGLTIPGLTPAKQQDIFGEIQAPITGGEEKTVRVLGEEDVDRAIEELSAPLYEQLSEKVRSKVSEDAFFFEEALKKEVIERTLSAEVDSEVEEFEISAKVRLSTIVFDRALLEQIVENDVQGAVSGDKKLIDSSINSGVSAELQNFDFESKRMGLLIKIEKTLYYVLDENLIRQEVQGKTQEEIETYLSESANIESFSVLLWPFWVNKAPGIDKKVEITLDITE